MFDRFKCNMSGASVRLDGNDRLHRDLLLEQIVERGSENFLSIYKTEAIL